MGLAEQGETFDHPMGLSKYCYGGEWNKTGRHQIAATTDTSNYTDTNYRGAVVPGTKNAGPMAQSMLAETVRSNVARECIIIRIDHHEECMVPMMEMHSECRCGRKRKSLGFTSSP